MPLTVKIRTGINDNEINVHEVVEGLKAAGARAVTIHGRTMESRYSKPADWDLIRDVAAAHPSFPIIGNGDILTAYDAQQKMGQIGGSISGPTGLMTGRGALIKPWIFKEYAEGKSYNPSAAERVSGSDLELEIDELGS